MFSTLTEHRCYDFSSGVYTIPEGVTYDIAEMRKQLPFHLVENTFKNMARVKALQLSELEEHLLKSIILFNPGASGLKLNEITCRT